MSGSIDLILAVAFVAYLVWVGKMFWEIRVITRRTKETMARTERTMTETARRMAETERLRQQRNARPRQ